MGVAGTAATTLPAARGSRAPGRTSVSKSSLRRLGFLLAAGLAVLQPAARAAEGISARDFASPPGTIDCGSVPLPPARFDHPSAHRVNVMHVPFGLIDNACRARGILAPTAFAGSNRSVALLGQIAQSDFEIQACSWTSGGDDFVLLPEVGTGGVTKDFETCALKHEVAHLNGWPASHPEARFGLLTEQSVPFLPAAAFAPGPPLGAVRLLRFHRTAEGAAFRRHEMKAKDSVIVMVTEIMVATRGR